MSDLHEDARQARYNSASAREPRNGQRKCAGTSCEETDHPDDTQRLPLVW
jgi:hypothetical protein